MHSQTAKGRTPASVEVLIRPKPPDLTAQLPDLTTVLESSNPNMVLLCSPVGAALPLLLAATGRTGPGLRGETAAGMSRWFGQPSRSCLLLL
jgi:hypothetical protein